MGETNQTITKKREIQITVHIPDKVTENIKQLKINRLYDILKPKTKSSK